MGQSLVETLQPYARSELTPLTRNYLRHLSSLYQPTQFKYNCHMQIGEQSKHHSISFSKQQASKWGAIELLQLTDLQFGHKGCKVDRVIGYRDWVLAQPNRYILMTGDNIDAATIFSPGTPWDNLFGPQSQAYRFAEIIAPARHRILGYVGGNHERRAMPAFGDIGIFIATLLQVPYSDGRQIIDIHFGQHQPFKVSLWHGIGGARTDGGIVNVLTRFMRQGDSQLYMMGHLHQGFMVPRWRTVRSTSGLKREKVIGMLGTSFLELWGTYAEVAGFEDSDVAMGCATVRADGGWDAMFR